MLYCPLCIFLLVFLCFLLYVFFFFSSRRRHTRSKRDWSSDVCSSDLSELPHIVIRVLANESARHHVELLLDHLGDLARGERIAELPVVLGDRLVPPRQRSEERRVGKECRSRWGREAEQIRVKRDVVIV